MKSLLPFALFWIVSTGFWMFGREAPPKCEPEGVVTLAAGDINETKLHNLIYQHRPRYAPAEVETLRVAMDRCNTQISDALTAIKVEQSTLLLRLQELQRFRDVDNLKQNLENSRQNRRHSAQELEKNLADIGQVGLYVVLLEKVDVYDDQENLRDRAKAALTPRAIRDLNGVFVKRSSESVNLQTVTDIIQSFTSGQVAEDQVLFDITNFELGADYFLYLAKISVRPLQKPLSNPLGEVKATEATVLNLESDLSYAAILLKKGVTQAHIDEIRQRSANLFSFVRTENEEATRRRDNILTLGQDELRRFDREIQDAESILNTRFQKIEAICKALGLPFLAQNPDQSAAAAAQELNRRIAELDARWYQTKEQEVQYIETNVTIQQVVAKELAEEAIKLSRKLEQQYERVAERNQSYELELHRKLRRIWVYPVGQDNGFKLCVFAVFQITRRPAPLSTETFGGDDPFIETDPPLQPISDSFVFVKGGTFWMGCTSEQVDCYPDESPAHRVSLSDFYLSSKELTFEEYDAFCAHTGRKKPHDEGWGRGRRPVINVTWIDAVQYCNWRSRQDGRQECYQLNRVQAPGRNGYPAPPPEWRVICDFRANGYRLPTEAEWEYAARQGGQRVLFGNGKNIADPQEMNFSAHFSHKKEYSIVGENRQKTTPVGSFPPNSLHLYDMSGNVWEWCYDRKGPYSANAQSNPQGASTGPRRVLRGSSWYGGPRGCRVSVRHDLPPDSCTTNAGFRLAMSAGF